MKRPAWATCITVLAVVLACGPLLRAGEAQDQGLFARLERLAPAGFTPARPPQVYGTAERKLRDGSIFDYMDGGGVAWLEHGYREMFHAEYAGGGEPALTLDVFDMGTAEGARAALGDERICPAGGAPPAFAPQGRAFRFPPDYYMYFPAGRHIVYLHVSDDRQGALLDRFAAEVGKLLEENPQ